MAYGTGPETHVTADMAQDLADLQAGWTDLPEKEHDFAHSMVAWHEKKGWLSPKQWHWVQKIAERLPDRQVPDFTKGLSDELAEIESLRAGSGSLAIMQTPAG